jgi:hypothetical protein
VSTDPAVRDLCMPSLSTGSRHCQRFVRRARPRSRPASGRVATCRKSGPGTGSWGRSAFSPDGKTLAAGYCVNNVPNVVGGKVVLFDVDHESPCVLAPSRERHGAKPARTTGPAHDSPDLPVCCVIPPVDGRLGRDRVHDNPRVHYRPNNTIPNLRISCGSRNGDRHSCGISGVGDLVFGIARAPGARTMATAARIEANRKNEKRSTGLKAEAGVVRSRLDALKQGERARTRPCCPTRTPGLLKMQAAREKRNKFTTEGTEGTEGKQEAGRGGANEAKCGGRRSWFRRTGTRPRMTRIARMEKVGGKARATGRVRRRSGQG